MMHKKVYKDFARMIRSQKNKAIAEFRIAPSHPALPAKLEQITQIENELVFMFQSDNPQFNAEKFIDACTIDTES